MNQVLVNKINWDYLRQTVPEAKQPGLAWMGIPIVLDESVPVDEVWVKDSRGVTKITKIGIKEPKR